jgi:alpha-tubulin suppressor-like RCC1 family protein
MTRAVLALSAIALVGCQSALTELVLVVTSDTQNLSQVSIRVDGPSGATAIDETVSLGAGDPMLPLTLSLTRSGEPYEPIAIVVTGTSPTAGTITRRATTGFVRGERRVLTIVLESVCGGVACSAPETCIDGLCRSDAIDPATLPPFGGEIPPIDAGTPRDGGRDAVAPDAPIDAGQDAGPPDSCGGTCGAGELCAFGTCLTAPWASVAIGDSHLCIVETSPGRVRCVGANATGQLGNGTTASSTAFVDAIGIADAVAVTAGRAHSCALTSTGRVSCWGANDQSQLGLDPMITPSAPTPTEITVGMGMTTAIAAGADHTCVLQVGSVHCWGSNTAGQLGDGTRTTRFDPGPAVVMGAAQLAPGGQFTCALLGDGSARCWGNNTSGQLGDGTAMQRLSPVAVMLPSGTTLSAIAAGVSHACGLTSASAVLCWGGGARGQLGDGTGTDRPLPTPTTDFGLASSIASGNQHVVARRTDALLYGWGDNGAMQLAPFTPTTSLAPVELDPGAPIERVWAAFATTCRWRSGAGPACAGRVRLPPL